jgi:hypothetical protein
VKWAKETDFNISVEKTKAILIHGRKPRVYERPKLKVRLGPNAIEIVRQHRILGLVIDVIDVKAQAGKKLLNTLALKKWGGDQKRYQMTVLSTLHYGESIYGTATKLALKTLEPKHNKSV